MTQVHDELQHAGLDDNMSSSKIRYYLTSIYDHSIYEALSRVVQRLIPQTSPTLENLLNILVNTCCMEKAYLFDVVSKLYISTDSSPVDMQSVELCSDMIDVVLDISGIYGGGSSHKETTDEEENPNHDSAYDDQSASVMRLNNGMVRAKGCFFFSELSLLTNHSRFCISNKWISCWDLSASLDW
eukprot:CAMPEP_0116825748 /NCGR_PEP_ID=MMETSP0418-20121206/2143_1 /TAXON_ID=1158023 /ORGANISM="Astrosyne radiata, Strain 13vi08-1A" /LENGTH=184 /DNA_ID=CAMNT_0004454301 /DNA_START=9 /DNA_END=560 /DNA_ORIENTATION=+